MKRKIVFVLVFLFLLVLIPTVVLADGLWDYEFATPVFGLAAAPDGSLLVADAGQGVVELRKGEGNLVTELLGVTDIAPIGRGAMFALTGGGEDPATAGKLYRVSHGQLTLIADPFAFEVAHNPDGGFIDSNPFDVELLDGGTVLIADAGGNSVLRVDDEGNIDLVAVLPLELAPTADLKTLLNCPTPPPLPPFFEGICEIPDYIPAEPVATSVAVGPDGAYYVSELKGFPAPLGMSRVWRLEPGTLGADCATSPACSVVYDDFTSIVDLEFAPDGTLYVTEIDEAGWFAVELAGVGFPGMVGGTINACAADGSGCSVVLSNVLIPSAVAVDKKGAAYAAVKSLIPGMAEVIALP